MTAILSAVFWLLVVVVAYTWIGYPVIVWTACLFQRNRRTGGTEEYVPAVTLLIVAHNEQAIIGDKIANSLALDYPQDKLQVLVASDGSTDQTDDIVSSYAARYKNIKLYRVHSQKGKTAVQNAAASHARGEIIVFTNADTMLDKKCLRLMVAHFSNPRVGCVAPKLIWANTDEGSLPQSGGIYWRFELALWEMESKLGIMAWAPGGAMAIRASAFRPMDARYGEDCVAPLDVVEQGYTVIYEPQALAYDAWPGRPADELRARRRMTLRSFGGTLSKFSAWHPLKRSLLAWAVISHKILRWLTPFLLGALLVMNVPLVTQPPYTWLMLGQGMFYGFAIVGWLGYWRGMNIPLASSIFSFCLAFFGIGWGVVDVIKGHEVAIFKTERLS